MVDRQNSKRKAQSGFGLIGAMTMLIIMVGVASTVMIESLSKASNATRNVTNFSSTKATLTQVANAIARDGVIQNNFFQPVPAVDGDGINGGGVIPPYIGLVKDGYGKDLGMCAFGNGPGGYELRQQHADLLGEMRDRIIIQNLNEGASAGRAALPTAPAFVIVSAGKNGRFDSSCSDYIYEKAPNVWVIRPNETAKDGSGVTVDGIHEFAGDDQYVVVDVTDAQNRQAQNLINYVTNNAACDATQKLVYRENSDGSMSMSCETETDPTSLMAANTSGGGERILMNDYVKGGSTNSMVFRNIKGSGNINVTVDTDNAIKIEAAGALALNNLETSGVNLAQAGSMNVLQLKGAGNTTITSRLDAATGRPYVEISSTGGSATGSINGGQSVGASKALSGIDNWADVYRGVSGDKMLFSRITTNTPHNMVVENSTDGAIVINSYAAAAADIRGEVAEEPKIETAPKEDVEGGGQDLGIGQTIANVYEGKKDPNDSVLYFRQLQAGDNIGFKVNEKGRLEIHSKAGTVLETDPVFSGTRPASACTAAQKVTWTGSKFSCVADLTGTSEWPHIFLPYEDRKNVANVIDPRGIRNPGRPDNELRFRPLVGRGSVFVEGTERYVTITGTGLTDLENTYKDTPKDSKEYASLISRVDKEKLVGVLKVLKAGDGITFDLREPEFIKIEAKDVGSANVTGVNMGTGSQVFINKTGNNLNFRTLRGIGGVQTAVSGNEITIGTNLGPACGASERVTWNGTTLGCATTGDVTTAANVGTGTNPVGVFRDKTGTTLNFKNLVPGFGINMTEVNGSIQIGTNPGVTGLWQASPAPLTGNIETSFSPSMNSVFIGQPAITTGPNTRNAIGGALTLVKGSGSNGALYGGMIHLREDGNPSIAPYGVLNEALGNQIALVVQALRSDGVTYTDKPLFMVKSFPWGSNSNSPWGVAETFPAQNLMHTQKGYMVVGGAQAAVTSPIRRAYVGDYYTSPTGWIAFGLDNPTGLAGANEGNIYGMVQDKSTGQTLFNTAPGQTMEFRVGNDATATRKMIFRLNSNAAQLGIGKIPTQALDVTGNMSTTGTITASGRDILSELDALNGRANVWQATGNDIRNTNTGNIGLGGAANASYKVAVTGSLYSNTSLNAPYIWSGGNLDVGGIANLTNARVGTGNFLLGNRATNGATTGILWNFRVDNNGDLYSEGGANFGGTLKLSGGIDIAGTSGDTFMFRAQPGCEALEYPLNDMPVGCTTRNTFMFWNPNPDPVTGGNHFRVQTEKVYAYNGLKTKWDGIYINSYSRNTSPPTYVRGLKLFTSSSNTADTTTFGIAMHSSIAAENTAPRFKIMSSSNATLNAGYNLADLEADDVFATRLGTSTERITTVFTTNINTTNAPNVTSDARLKDNVETLSGMLDKVMQLRAVSYIWKEGTEAAKAEGEKRKIHLGVIAQELEKVFPELVHTDDKGMKSVDYTGLISPIIDAIQELHTANQKLAAENQALKSTLQQQAKALQNMEQRLSALEEAGKAKPAFIKAATK